MEELRKDQIRQLAKVSNVYRKATDGRLIKINFPHGFLDDNMINVEHCLTSLLKPGEILIFKKRQDNWVADLFDSEVSEKRFFDIHGEAK